MASTYSDLKIELIATGEQSGTWGTTTNTNLGTALEEAIVGRATANFTTDADLTLTLTDTNATQVARHYILNVTSGVSLSTTRNLIVPTIDKPYIIENNTTGGQSIIVKTSGGSGVTVPNGKTVMVYADSTDVVAAQDHIPSLTLGSALPVASGGTGATTLTGVVKGNGTSAFTAGSVNLATEVTGTLPIGNGGTGLTATPTNGQIDIGNGTGFTRATLTPGTGISITNGTGSITVAATNNGTVTSVGGTGTVNGITLTGTVTSSGNLTLGGTLSGVNLTSQVTGTLPVANGGTGATSLTANNVVLGNGTSAVQFVAPGANGNVLTSNGTTWTSAAPAAAVSLSANNAFTGANTFYNSTGQTFGTGTSTQDGIIIAGRAGGSTSLRVTLQPGTLTASRTLTLPDNTGTVLTTGATVTVAQGGTGATSLSGVVIGNGTSAFTVKTNPSGAFVGTTDTQTLTNKTISGADNTVTVDGTNAVGFRTIPQNSQSSAYTLVLADSGKHILHPSADTTARTFTIPANSSVAFPLGTAITFINQNGAGVVTIAITTDTMRLAGAGTTGSRTLAANGIATAVKITSTEWIISGTGLT